jgi:hypothetical protein
MLKYFFLFLIVISSGVLFAQDIQELLIGSHVSGNLRHGEEIIYSVRPAQAGILTVETTGNIDTYLEAYDDQLNFIADDDDSGVGYNARLEIVVAGNRTYYFLLTGYDDYVSGHFSISANLRNLPNPAQLRVGSVVSGHLASWEDHWYSVRTATRGTLIVETIGNTDTMLEAYNELYELIAEDDDSGEGFNARIEIQTEANSTYIFRLKGYSDSSGPFRILAIIE